MSESGSSPFEAVARHYGHADLAEPILALAAAASGKALDKLEAEDLGPFDEFHSGGQAATLKLLERAGFAAGGHLLDIGCGIGGPARLLARKARCQVTGLDLNPGFCKVAALLTDAVGLAGQVSFREGNALDLPFEAGSFDGGWMLHASMNIPDKATLTREIARVVKPGGRFSCYEILAGEAGPPDYPTPWAGSPEISFLADPGAWRGQLEAAGLAIEAWHDLTPDAEAWFAQSVARLEGGAQPPPIGRLVMGESFPAKVTNLRNGFRDGRLKVVEAHCRRG